MPATAELLARSAHFSALDAALAIKLNEGGGLPRHDWWRREYYQFPYLVGATNEAIAERFCDVFLNLHDLNSRGAIVPRMSAETEFDMVRKFTHVMEEWNSRGGMPMEVIQTARIPVLAYAKANPPIGVRLFEKYAAPTGDIFVKYSKGQFVRDMYERGLLRVSPASFYSASTHNSAIKDKETLRPFIVPTFKQRMRGEKGFEFNQHKIQYADNDLETTIEMPEYYLCSLSNHVYHRLPTDFDADAALVIRDRKRFSEALKRAFSRQKPGYQTMTGDAVYYDPYLDFKKVRLPEMSKHFRYSYQREYRFAFTTREYNGPKLEPIFLELGSMKEYADLLV